MCTLSNDKLPTGFYCAAGSGTCQQVSDHYPPLGRLYCAEAIEDAISTLRSGHAHPATGAGPLPVQPDVDTMSRLARQRMIGDLVYGRTKSALSYSNNPDHETISVLVCFKRTWDTYVDLQKKGVWG